MFKKSYSVNKVIRYLGKRAKVAKCIVFVGEIMERKQKWGDSFFKG